MAAESILAAIISQIIRKLLSTTTQQLGVAFGTEANLNKLGRILRSIRTVLVDADDRQNAESGIKIWLSALKDAAYKVDDVLDDFIFEARRKSLNQENMLKEVLYYCSFSNSITSFKLCWRLNAIIKKMEDLADEIHRFNFQVNRVPISGYCRPQTHSEADKKNIVGREKDKEDIVSSLINYAASNNEKIMVLPIVAMGGMGKTTLSQLIYKDHRVKSHFQLRMWVYVSDAKFDLTVLVRLIIEAANKQTCNVLSMELLQDQLKKIIKGKRYLIVLDDVWNENQNQWDELKTFLDYGGDGSAVVVSTRSIRVAKMMASRTIHYLEQLSEEDSWELFRRRAFLEGTEEPASLVKIGKDILKRCDGLPLAIAMIGGMLRHENDEVKWKAVLDSEMWQLGVANNNILPALSVSYNYLPSHMKLCFSFCAIYPKKYRMEKDTLIQLWIANGFIPFDGEGDLESLGIDIFNELVCRSFFQNVQEFEPLPSKDTQHIDEVKCHMHDLMHDLAKSIMGKECLISDQELRDIPSTAKHLFMTNFQKLNLCNQPVIPSIYTIMSWNSYSQPKIPSKFSSKLKTLRVLDCKINIFKKLKIRHWRHLRFLDLSFSDMEELPKGICSLYNLQTLKLSKCFNLKKLPNNLTDLRDLRHLYINGCDKLVCMPKGMGRLKQLHTLTKYIVGSETERGIEQLRDLNLSGTLHLYNMEKVSNALDAENASFSSKHNLHSIMLHWNGVGSLEVFEALKPHNRLKNLGVFNYENEQFPSWMNDSQQLQNLVKIAIDGCRTCKELPPLGQLSILKKLHLHNIDEVKHIVSKTIWYDEELQTTLFPSLEVLSLSNMKNLESLWEIQGSSAQVIPDMRKFFPCLESMNIENCMNLGVIPAIPSLQELILRSCNANLNNLFSFTSDERVELFQLQELHLNDCQGLIHFSACLPSILSLLIENCNNLESISGPGGFTRLEQLCLNGCDVLASLPQEMECLILLEIVCCNGLTTLPEGLTKLESLILDICGCLEYLPKGMESLIFLNILECNGITSLPEGLIKLRVLELVSCDGLVSLPEGMESLTSLEILGCNRLISLPNDLIKLRSLRLNKLDGLVSLPEGMEGLNQLESLDISCCNRLRSLPEGLHQRLPYLTSLKIIGNDELIRPFKAGGDYCHLIENIPDRTIENIPE